ncbi:MAG TPA: hypothetical protein VNO70_18370 [Blastocatellia bacterium]|nr:hypothetical protein [Blastocatellia bacterium]
MKRILAIAVLTLLASVSALAQSAEKKPDAAMPTTDQILDKFVQASGGKAAIEKITSRTQKGTFDLPAMGASGTVEIYEKAPNKTVAIIDITGFGVIREGFNGTVAWAEDPQQGLREKTGAELAAAKLDSVFHRPLKLKELFPKMTLKGKEKVGEREAYLIEATPAEGSMEKWYFDTQTGLLIRSDSERESPMGKMPVETYLEDYRDVDGVKLPHTIRQSTPAFAVSIKISEVKQNVEIEDAKFNKPAAK